MTRFTRINRRSLWHSIDVITLAFISLLIQFYYFLGYVDQGSLFDAIKNGEPFIYLFNAFIYLYVFWKLSDKIKIKLASIALAVAVPIVYTVHFATYYNYLRLAVATSPETKQEFMSILSEGIIHDLSTSTVKYVIALALMLAICLTVAIITTQKLAHKLHVFRMKLRKKQDLGMYELKNLTAFTENEVFFSNERRNCFVPINSEGAPLLDGDGTVELLTECRDFETHKRYVLFTFDEMNEDNDYIVYAAERDKNNRLLPIKSQRLFDTLESLLNRC